MARSEPEQPTPSPGNPTIPKGSEPPVRVGRPGALGFRSGIFLSLREQAPHWQVVVIGLLGVGGCLALWWFVTRGEPEERIVSPSKGRSSPLGALCQLSQPLVRSGSDAQPADYPAPGGLRLRPGHAGGRAPGCALRVL